MTDHICHTCKTNLKNSKLEKDYTIYDDTEGIVIICKSCVNEDLFKRIEQWDDMKFAWHKMFSSIEKMFYETMAEEATEKYPEKVAETVIDLDWDEIQSKHILVAWRILETASSKKYGMPESPPEDTFLICQITKQDLHEDKIDRIKEELVCKCHHQPIRRRLEIKKMISQDTADQSMFSHIFCKMCADEKKPQNIKLGWTRTAFLAQCLTHDVEIVHFPVPPEFIPKDCECPDCMEEGK